MRPETISRERRHIGAQGGYQAATAQREALERQHAASWVPRIDPTTWREVERALREDWSPDETDGRRR